MALNRVNSLHSYSCGAGVWVDKSGRDLTHKQRLSYTLSIWGRSNAVMTYAQYGQEWSYISLLPGGVIVQTIRAGMVIHKLAARWGHSTNNTGRNGHT